MIHVSHLRMCVHDSSVTISPDELEGPEIKPEAAVPRRHVRIVEQSTKQLRNKVVKLVRVQWSGNEGDSTWETEKSMRRAYPEIFPST